MVSNQKNGGANVSFEEDADQFSRLHKIFVFHLGVAVGLAWMTALYAALHTPFVRNIRPLIDPESAGRVESTWSFLFGMPLVLTLAWVMVFFGSDVLRQIKLCRNQTLEFAAAAAVAFGVFYMSIDRAVAAILIAL